MNNLQLAPELEQQLMTQARVRGLTVAAYVEEFLVQTPPHFAQPRSVGEIELLLDEAADLVPAESSLPDSATSRESIYAREDEW
jgi:hypothetical protein